MFTNQRGNAGLAGIIGVGVLMAMYLASAGLLVKAYREGGTADTSSGCQVTCRQTQKSASRG